MTSPPEQRVEVPASIGSAEELHLYLQQALQFPAHYGCNLDALWDCATEGPPWPVCIVWPSRWVNASTEFTEQAARVREVLQEAARENWLLRVELAAD